MGDTAVIYGGQLQYSAPERLPVRYRRWDEEKTNSDNMVERKHETLIPQASGCYR